MDNQARSGVEHRSSGLSGQRVRLHALPLNCCTVSCTRQISRCIMRWSMGGRRGAADVVGRGGAPMLCIRAYNLKHRFVKNVKQQGKFMSSSSTVHSPPPTSSIGAFLRQT
ncbi:uncharacterized protein LOC124656071 [Lolium rigidum]|uniref:uncharacterized protein LOC124656071 n=1 Tax=Lolium rigidum TaxID=89674 RepID=UPI001F5D6B6C|nr:uncharacterized protein LOC124656071 [Lolium rigidum]